MAREREEDLDDRDDRPEDDDDDFRPDQDGDDDDEPDGDDPGDDDPKVLRKRAGKLAAENRRLQRRLKELRGDDRDRGDRDRPRGDRDRSRRDRDRDRDDDRRDEIDAVREEFRADAVQREARSMLQDEGMSRAEATRAIRMLDLRGVDPNDEDAIEDEIAALRRDMPSLFGRSRRSSRSSRDRDDDYDPPPRRRAPRDRGGREPDTRDRPDGNPTSLALLRQYRGR